MTVVISTAALTVLMVPPASRLQPTHLGHAIEKKLEGAHESAYLRQVLAFNAEKYRGHVTLAMPPFG